MSIETLNILLSGLISFVQAEPVLTAVSILSLALLVHAFLSARRISRLTKGGDGKTLEATIVALRDRVNSLEGYAKRNQKAVTDIDQRVTRSVQGVSVERFDPFENAGQQSFSTALLNEKGDGVVISGIHSRDGVRVYAKEVSEFKSERELSKEEQQALQQSKTKLDQA